MSVLQPYIDSGKLVVRSGQTEFSQCATEGWSSEKAQARMENLILHENYGPDGVRLSAVLSPNDSVALGITNALLEAGYTSDNFPVLTGMDCDIAAVKNIISGFQSMSIFCDICMLEHKTMELVAAIAAGTALPINDITAYNGVRDIQTFLCEPVVVTADNIEAVLVASGFYDKQELALE